MAGHDLAAQNVRICMSVFLINTRHQPAPNGGSAGVQPDLSRYSP
jgi:hypothetical protein